MPKDNFSAHAADYQKFRPRYPSSLYECILPQVQLLKKAWDCGTGNGQVASVLAQSFEMVYATDISANQLEQAEQKNNIIYSSVAAEKTNFPDDFFDLITVGQAVHWFQFDAFYGEVMRTLKLDGILAVFGYGNIQVNEKIDEVVQYLYSNILGEYWDSERKYIDDHYTSLPFPFADINCPPTMIKLTWEIEDILGYLNTWSALKHYVKANNKNPIDFIEDELRILWTAKQIKEVRFPIFLRMGRKTL